MTYVLFNPLACHDKMEEVIAPLVDSLGQDVRALDIREINDYAAEAVEQLLSDALGNSAEVSVVYGGQPLYPFIISAE